MNVAAPVALLLAWASPASLDDARRAFAAGDYAAAEQLALAATEDAPAAALYVAGLARFRAGRAAEALEALDRAEAGADSPAAWRFNRGACLYELGRWAEAEAAFVDAAADPAFEALALVNAGFAALDGGSPERARELAQRARAAAADGPALALVEELEQALGPAPAAVAAPAPAVSPPASPPTSGAAAWSSRARARLDVGWDSDAPRAGIGAVERPGGAAAVGSDFVAAAAGSEVALPVGGATLAAGYSLEQLAYLSPPAEDYSVQQHDVVLAVRAHRDPSTVLEAALFGQYALTGVSDLRGMQAAAGARLSAAYAWGDRQVTRALIGATAKDGRGAEFAPLDGSRLEAAASHEVRLGSFLVDAGYRFQLERIGVVTTRLPVVFPPGSAVCPLGCTAADVERLSYQGHTGWLGIRHEPRPWLRLDVTGGVEGRWELDELHTVLTASDGGEVVVGRRRRSDVRGFGSEALALRLGPGLFFTLRHEWLVNRTRVEAISYVPPRALGTSGWDKHVLAAGLTLDW